MSVRTDSYWMNRALVSSRKGLGFVHPNPMVGAVVLDDQDNLVGEGFHSSYGSSHAEVHALKAAGAKAKNGTLYVTLEPCCHHGKTPPCTDAILHSGIKNVFVACLDPNSKVAGKGIQALQKAGLNVKVGICESRAKKLNAAFFHLIQHQAPFVRAKVAMTVDGFMGRKDQRLMLSGAQLERITMRLRAESHGIMVGVNTVLTDDPRMNVRGKNFNQKPVRIIIDSQLRTPSSARIFEKKNGDVWIFCDEKKIDSKEWKALFNVAQLIPMAVIQDKIPPQHILNELAKKGLTSILIEGGVGLLQSFEREKLIHQWIIYLNSNNLKLTHPAEKLVKLDPNPLFALEFQSVIRRDQDLVITSKSDK